MNPLYCSIGMLYDNYNNRHALISRLPLPIPGVRVLLVVPEAPLAPGGPSQLGVEAERAKGVTRLAIAGACRRCVHRHGFTLSKWGYDTKHTFR